MINKKAMLSSVGNSPYNIPFLNLLISVVFIFIYLPCTLITGQLCLFDDYFTLEVDDSTLFMGEIFFLLIIGGSFMINGIRIYKVNLNKFEGD
tara:strand:- start:1124 stop:1402 length:279 start_codon:yes stop_codon:yes gene_type:complete